MLQHGGCRGARHGCSICMGFQHDWRDSLLTATLTTGCCRVEDGANLDAGDFWPDHDAQAGYVHYEGCCTLNIKKMKMDQHQRAVESDSGARGFQTWTLWLLSEKTGRCLERLVAVWKDWLRPFSPTVSASTLHKTVSASTVHTAGLVGVDTALFSRICARKGGSRRLLELWP